MTGYGRGRAEQGGWRVTAEIRSVNHRFMDLKLRGSSLHPSVEERASRAVRDRVERGAITVTLRVDRGAAAVAVQVDVAAARRMYVELSRLAEAVHAPPPSLALLCEQPGVLISVEPETDSEAVAGCLMDAITAALDGLVAMRETEGASLAQDLGARFARLGELVSRIGSETASVPLDASKRLRERLERLLKNSNIEVDEQRLAQEVALVADRLDVTEELVRLASHLEQVSDVLAQPSAAVGKRLGFLVQEIGREFNTVGSKSQSAAISQIIVEAKAELEKIREQVQNIE